MSAEWDMLSAANKVMDEADIPKQGRRCHMTKQQVIHLFEDNKQPVPANVLNAPDGTIFEFELGRRDK